MVASTRSPKPILQNVKLEVHEDQAILLATDMEIGIRVNVAGLTTEVAGSALLSVVQFGSILRESTDESLSIETNGQSVTVRGQRSRFRLPSIDPLEFPHITEFTVESYHLLPARLMKELIRRTLFATDTESTRYALGGVLLETEDGKITAVATDGRRLAKMEGQAQVVGEPGHADVMTIVPSRSMQLIERSLGDGEGEVKIATRGNDFLVCSPKATIVSRLVEGRFPRWRDVMPHRPDSIQIDMTVGPLYAALRQAAIVTSGESRGVDFTLGDGSLVLSGLTADVGESHVELPIPYEGAPMTLTLDHRYVTDFLRVLDPERTFCLNVVDGDSAALLLTDDGYEYLIMPLARDRKKHAEADAATAG
jgi:DNA polymerase-3 subunit beta